MARHNLSEAGRLRCGEAGSANLKRWQETHADQRATIEAAVEAFRSELIEQLGGEAAITGMQAAGVVSACALYTSILQTERTLLGAQSRIARVVALQTQLPVSVGSLLRVLRSLGINLRGADEGDAGAESEEALLARYAGGDEKEGRG